MEFLGVGPLELLFIVVIIIVVVGPRDMQKTARALGRGLNTLYRSDLWRVIRFGLDELRTLPNKLAREAGLEESKGAPPPVAPPDPGLSAWRPPAPPAGGAVPPESDAPAELPAPPAA